MSALVCWAPVLLSQQYVSIQTALDNDWISLKLEGAFDKKAYKEVIDQNGVHFGKCIVVDVKNKLDSTLNIQIDNGIELYSNDTNVQNIIITKRVNFDIQGNQKIKFKLYAMCAQISKEVPRKGVHFELGTVCSSRLLKVVNRIEHDDMQNLTGQFALWAVTDAIDKLAFLKYSTDEKLLNKVIQLLDSSGVKTTLNRKNPASLTHLISQNKKNAGEYSINLPVSETDTKPPTGISFWFTREYIGYGFLIMLAFLFVVYYILFLTGVISRFKNYMYPQDMDDDIDGLGDLV